MCACLASAPARSEDGEAARKQAQVAEVVVQRAAPECFTSLVHASGYLVPRQTAVVMFPAPGYRITEVRAKVGDVVKRGDIVARVAPLGPSVRTSDATSDTTSATALPTLASGIVLQSIAVVGSPTSQEPLFTIAVDGTIEASVAVPSVHVLDLKAGEAARVTTSDGGVFEGRVRRPPAIVDPASQMGTARLSIEAGRGLAPGRFVQATIEARRSCGIGVPTAAVRRKSTGAYVQVVKNGIIESRAVTLGLASATDNEIVSGLAAGDVVLAGTGTSRDGDRVKPVFSDLQGER